MKNSKNIKQKQRSRKTKRKYKHKKLQKKYYGGTNEYKIIGRGHRVNVMIKIGDSNFVYKIFQPGHDKNLAQKQCNIQKKIQEFDEIIMFKNVKIPKLFSCKSDDTGEMMTLKFQRIYNIVDTDINEPLQPTNILLRFDEDLDSYEKNDKPLNYIKQYMDIDTYRRYIYELGQLFGILNFLCQIKTDDVEIIFGKLKIDGLPKLFVIDFDQCTEYNLDRILQMMNNDSKLANFDFDILGRKHDMSLKNLDDESKQIFGDGYITSASSIYNDNPEKQALIIQLARNIINNY